MNASTLLPSGKWSTVITVFRSQHIGEERLSVSSRIGTGSAMANVLRVNRKIATMALSNTSNFSMWTSRILPHRCLTRVSPCRTAHHRLQAAPCPFFTAPSRRSYQSVPPKVESSSKNSIPISRAENLTSRLEVVTPTEQRRSDWSIIKKLMQHVWPRNDWHTRGRVLFGFGLLISGKVCYRLDSYILPF